MRFPGTTLSSRRASDTSSSGRYGTSGLVTGTPEISASSGNAAAGSQQQHGRMSTRGQGPMCEFRCALSNAYTRVGCFRARERSCANMARDFYARERHCGLSAYARHRMVNACVWASNMVGRWGQRTNGVDAGVGVCGDTARVNVEFGRAFRRSGDPLLSRRASVA